MMDAVADAAPSARAPGAGTGGAMRRMPHDWHDPEAARRWDRGAAERNPVRAEQLDILVSLLAASWRPGDWLVDLGYGSGQVEEMIFGRVPDARIVGVDSSAAMMDLARERLAAFAGRFEGVRHDLAALDGLRLPEQPYRFAIAVQSLHHLSQEEMRAAYRWIHGRLEPGGLFLLLDRLRVENAEVWRVMRRVWERQDRVYGSAVAAHEGESFPAHEQVVRERGDRPVLLEQHLRWLREAGFDAACLHLHGNRALVAGIKGE
jgi:tRNA (cmo5U34)-methyltransferase